MYRYHDKRKNISNCSRCDTKIIILPHCLFGKDQEMSCYKGVDTALYEAKRKRNDVVKLT